MIYSASSMEINGFWLCFGLKQLWCPQHSLTRENYAISNNVKKTTL